MTDEVVRDLFNETANREKPISGLMGNEEFDEFERQQVTQFLKSAVHFDGIDTSLPLLDAGCGLGRNIPVLRDAGFTNITGFDFSPVMLEKFRQRYPDIPASEMDLTDLSAISDNAFETTFCMYVLIHITDDEMCANAISEMERVTAGHLIIGQVMDAENKPSHRVCKVREYFEMHPWFKKKKLHHHYKNLYEFPAPDNSAINRISFSIFK